MSARLLDTPIGPVRLLASEDALVKLDFSDRLEGVGARAHPVLEHAARELDEYFRGLRSCFTFPYEPTGTAFQRRVWSALRTIPYGHTRTYVEIARALDRPTAYRAVGAANALNPIAIVIPCHRVIGADGTLTGYAGGLHRKRWLLAHEQSAPTTDPTSCQA